MYVEFDSFWSFRRISEMRLKYRQIAAVFQVVLFTVLIAPILFAQQTPADDVVSIKTELVQTAVTVVDKNGKFVEGLNRADFELIIDGRPRPISFLERITAGSEREAQLTLPKQPESSAPGPVAVSPTVRGRTIVFFIDDLHLSLSSLGRTRDMIAHFLNTEVSSKDSVAIASAKGQIGFLQQFTNNQEVLRAALARINVQPSVNLAGVILNDKGKIAGSFQTQRIPYGTDLALKSLNPGSYELRVKVTDASAATTATQTTDFVVR